MARETTITVVDDIDGTEGAATVAFSLDGKHYVIDLAEANETKLREVLAPFLAAARKAGASPVLRSVGGTASRLTAFARARGDRTDNTEKREWLRSAGFTVSERGRLSRDAEAAWSAELARRATVGAETPTETPEAASEAVSPPEDTPPADATVRTKVGKLTSANITALRDVGLLLEGSGATFAILEGDRPTAMKNIEKLMGDMATKRGHPYSSLVAVRLKLRNNEERFVEQISA